MKKTALLTATLAIIGTTDAFARGRGSAMFPTGNNIMLNEIVIPIAIIVVPIAVLLCIAVFAISRKK